MFVVEGSRMPELFENRTMGLKVVLVLLVPLVFGAICGLVLGPSATWYLVLQGVAALGGLLAGLEHRKLGQAAIRGLLAGLVFGIAIVAAHLLSGATDHGLMPQPVLLPVITAVAGALLTALGSLLRRRLEPSVESTEGS
jgi:apolipoprotein N-acyltransferase